MSSTSEAAANPHSEHWIEALPQGSIGFACRHSSSGCGKGSPYDQEGRFPSVFWHGPNAVRAPELLAARQIVTLSAAIRAKPQWWAKVEDEEIVARWREEALDLSDAAFTRCIAELRHLAATRVSPECRPAPVDGAFESDGAVGESLARQVREGIEHLRASVPRDEHPGSDGLVVDLHHPSLWPFISDLTTVLPGRETALRPRPEATRGRAAPPRAYMWLPADVSVSADGTRCTLASQVNGLPRAAHGALYDALEGILAAALPLMEATLTELRRADPSRMLSAAPRATCCDPSDLWETMSAYKARREREGPADAAAPPSGADSDASEDLWEDWMEGRRAVAGPEVPPFAPPVECPERLRVRLAGRSLQVITKIASIELTPEKPAYPGGTWHVEGEPQEAIVATVIYYAEQTNVTEARLRFRRAVDECQVDYEQNDAEGVRLMYGIDLQTVDGMQEAQLNEEVGDIRTAEGRLVCFPNRLQHRLMPFRLADGGVPGRRTIVALFLVDPALRLVSTADVLPQEPEALAAVLRAASPRLEALPAALVAKIASHVPGCLDWEAAKAHRLALMEERKQVAAVLDDEYYNPFFSLCEH